MQTPARATFRFIVTMAWLGAGTALHAVAAAAGESLVLGSPSMPAATSLESIDAAAVHSFDPAAHARSGSCYQDWCYVMVSWEGKEYYSIAWSRPRLGCQSPSLCSGRLNVYLAAPLEQSLQRCSFNAVETSAHGRHRYYYTAKATRNQPILIDWAAGNSGRDYGAEFLQVDGIWLDRTAPDGLRRAICNLPPDNHRQYTYGCGSGARPSCRATPAKPWDPVNK